MTSVSNYAAALTSYIVAALAIFSDLVANHGGKVASFLGFVLLLARLVQEVPKAVQVILGRKSKDNE